MDTGDFIACEFIVGDEDYIDLEERPVIVSPLGDGGTVVSAHVCHASGDWVQRGEVYRTTEGYDLVYYTYCDGELATEQYGCTIKFVLKEIPYDPSTNFTLKHVAEYKEPEGDMLFT